MRSKTLLIPCFLLMSLMARAEKQNYPVSEIPKELQTGAGAVIRYDSTSVQLSGTDIIIKNKFVITILNARGAEWSTFRKMYNDFSSIDNINGKLYDADGTLISKLKKSNIVDISSFGSSYTFHDDLRMKAYTFNHNIYPYTVEYEYTSKSGSSFFMPDWQPQPGESVAVEKSVFLLTSNGNNTVQYRASNLPEQVQVSAIEEKALKGNKWSVEHIKAFYPEQATETGSCLARIKFSPGQVNFNHFTGSTESWTTYGDFFYRINKDRDQLPPEMVEKIKKMTDTISAPADKIAFLYKYLQKNTRYVANEFGLAGWQTFPAADVHRLGYGDCKGLSNYMKALLKAIDIPAHLVMVNAGEASYEKIKPDFVSYAFNHMILCVPQPQDTIWLECTSTSNAPGYLGSFTQNRNVMLLTPEGGKIVRTPHYDKKRSYVKKHIELQIDPEQKEQNIKWSTEYAGLSQENILPLYLSIDKDKKLKERIRTTFPYKDLKIEQADYTIEERSALKSPKISEQLQLKVANLFTETGDRLFVSIPIEDNPVEQIKSYEKRTRPFVLQKDLSYQYSLKISIPEGYTLTNLPQELNSETPFGSLSAKVRSEQGHLYVTINVLQNSGVFAAEMFEQYHKFNKQTEQYLRSVNFSLQRKN